MIISIDLKHFSASGRRKLSFEGMHMHRPIQYNEVFTSINWWVKKQRPQITRYLFNVSLHRCCFMYQRCSARSASTLAYEHGGSWQCWPCKAWVVTYPCINASSNMLYILSMWLEKLTWESGRLESQSVTVGADQNVSRNRSRLLS